MAVKSVGGGVTVSHPSTVSVVDSSARATRGAARSTRRRRGAGNDAQPPAPRTETEAILSGLSESDVDLVKRLDITPSPSTRRARGGGGAAGAQVEVSVDLAPDEDAVVLVEQEGEYHWELPDGTALGAQRMARSRGAGGKPRSRTVTFRVTVGATVAAPTRRKRGGGAASPRRSRGLLKKVVAFVFKFARKIVSDLVIKKLEEKVKPGLVWVSTNAPEGWESLGDTAQLPTPDDRPARVLLLVHGTFSSTMGSFSGLCHTPEGLAMLNALMAHYDLVIGYDHRTLSELPHDNATQILARLARINWKHPPEIDAIGYSRGGLVLRTLLEGGLQSSAFNASFRNAVFVGCTNGGTLLAEPENWAKLVDVYTNLAAAATRGLKFIPQTRAIANILTVTVKGIGILVKYLASFIIDGGGVPGLSAMEPDGDIVTGLNARGRPTTAAQQYLAITNDYEPKHAERDGSAEVIPASLRMKLADGLVDRLMGEANDLVVNTAAMTTWGSDPWSGPILALGVNGRTIHTTYFRDPKVVAQLGAWLLPTTLAGNGAGDGATRRARGKVARGAAKRSRGSSNGVKKSVTKRATRTASANGSSAKGTAATRTTAKRSNGASGKRTGRKRTTRARAGGRT